MKLRETLVLVLTEGKAVGTDDGKDEGCAEG